MSFPAVVGGSFGGLEFAAAETDSPGAVGVSACTCEKALAVRWVD